MTVAWNNQTTGPNFYFFNMLIMTKKSQSLFSEKCLNYQPGFTSIIIISVHNIIRSTKNGKYMSQYIKKITRAIIPKTYLNSGTTRVEFSAHQLSKYSLHINPLYSFFMNMNYSCYALYDCET
jgi:hypothetical protein